MNDLIIERTVKTPSIIAKASGEIIFRGISVPENTIEFYEPLKIWMDEYKNAPAIKTVCNIQLDYFNTSTANIILNFFKLLSSIQDNGNDVVINWYYEKNDFEIQESGNDFKSLVVIPFNIIEIDPI